MLNSFFLRAKKYIYSNEKILIYENIIKNEYKVLNNITISYASEKNLKDILYFQDKKYIDIFKKFLQMGDTGYFAYIDKNCIHRSWVKSNNQIVYPHWTLPYKLKDNEIFIHYCETAPEARGRKIYPHVLSEIIQEHTEKKVLIAVNKKNIASINGIEKVGFKQKFIIQTIVLLGIKIKRYLNNDK